MPIFYRERDINTLRLISKELVQKVIDTEVVYFKINTEQTQINIYGQAVKGSKGGKKIYPAIKLHALIQHEKQVYEYIESIRVVRNIRFKFLISTLTDHNVYPQIGDIIGWSRQYYQITSVTQQQLIAGQAQIEWSKICESVLLSKSKVQKILGLVGYDSE